MKKTSVILAVLMLMCCFMIPASCAEYGYTTVDSIPMAVDFNVRVELDENGLPQIITDYPFEETGATELNLVYYKDGNEAFSLRYRHATKSTLVPGYNPAVLGSDSMDAPYQAIRDGEVSLGDEVCIGTSYFGQETDWFLYYSLGEQRYTRYAERTFAQAFNAMGPGGLEKSVFYANGQIVSSRTVKRLENADLDLWYTRNGDIESGDITVYSPQSAVYSLDISTGLFDGHKLTEFGFDEAELEIPSLAATGDKVSTVVAVPKDDPAAIADRSAFTLTGGLLSGILIGLVLYILLHRKKNTPAEPAEMEEIPDSSADQTPEETFDSTPKTFSAGR